MRQPHSITSKLGQMVANSRKLWTTLQFISSAAYAISRHGAWSSLFRLPRPSPASVARCPLRSGVSNVGKKRSRNCCEGTRAHSARLEPTHHDPLCPSIARTTSIVLLVVLSVQSEDPWRSPLLSSQCLRRGSTRISIRPEMRAGGGGHSPSAMAIRASARDNRKSQPLPWHIRAQIRAPDVLFILL